MGGVHIELGLDSFVGCLIVARLVPRWRHRLCLSLAFGILDGLASFAAGLGWGPTGWPAIAAVVCVLMVVLCLREPARFAVLPLLLCLDNLTTPLKPLDAVPAGAASAVMAALGFVVYSHGLRPWGRLRRRSTYGTAPHPN